MTTNKEYVGSWSCIRFAESIVPEAFDGKPDCVPRQISAATGLPLNLVMQTLNDVLEPDWRAGHKFTIEELQRVAQTRGTGLYVFHGPRLVLSEAA